MDPLQQVPDRSDQAEAWVQRLQSSDLSAQERTAFERWRDESPEHELAYERATYLFARAADLRTDPRWRELAQSARQRTAKAAHRRRTLRWSLATAAVLILAVTFGWWAWNPAEPQQRLATALGERNTFTLSDGSNVVLDTDSVVRVQYSRKQRDVILERGRAQFSVAKGPQRPFVVQVENGVVRAVGTEFQVRRDDRSVLVTLLEGAITVNAPSTSHGDPMRSETLTAGEQLRFDGDRLWARSTIDVAAARCWTRGELVFVNRPLAELIDEMNRYTATKLHLGDPSIGALPVSGAFYDNDQESLIRALEVGWSLRAERVSPTQIVLHRRR